MTIQHDVPLLQVNNLVVNFPILSGIIKKVTGHVQAVRGVDFHINKGEVLGLVGETGSGKSTIGRAILRLIEPTSGTVTFQGENLLEMDKEALKEFRKKAQIVFQDPFASLNPRKTILDSLGEGMLYHGIVKTREAQIEKAAEVLSMIGMPKESLWRYPHQFSGGQQQRICIGRAISLNPSLIVCDEAVSALDVSVQAQILNLLQELKKKLSLSYLIISHDLTMIKYLCDRVVVLYLGKVMEEGMVEDIFENPCHPYTQALLSAIPKNHPGEKKIRMQLFGEIPSPIHPPSGCPFRTRCPFAEPTCISNPPKKVIINNKTGCTNHEYNCILNSNSSNN